MKGIVADMLYKADTVHLQFVYFGAKFHILDLLSTHNRTHIRLMQRDNSVRHPALFAKMKLPLLFLQRLDSLQTVQAAASNFLLRAAACPTPSINDSDTSAGSCTVSYSSACLFPVPGKRQVSVPHFLWLARLTRSFYSSDTVNQRIYFTAAFPYQLRVRGIGDVAFITGCIC